MATKMICITLMGDVFYTMGTETISNEQWTLYIYSGLVDGWPGRWVGR